MAAAGDDEQLAPSRPWFEALPYEEQTRLAAELDRRGNCPQLRTPRQRIGWRLIGLGLVLSLVGAVPIAQLGYGGRSFVGVLLLSPFLALCVVGCYLTGQWSRGVTPLTEADWALMKYLQAERTSVGPESPSSDGDAASGSAC